jgi:5-dehydro-2-deoxygluconokinase
MGCAVIDGPIPASLDDAFNGQGVTVEVLNVLGAGDAFSAGFLSGWVRGEIYDNCARYANACGALVVSRHGCAPAMPTRIELDHYLANAQSIPRPTATRCSRGCTARRRRACRGPSSSCSPSTTATRCTSSRARRERARAASPRSRSFSSTPSRGPKRTRPRRTRRPLCDDRYGQDALNAATGRGWWIGRPVELPGSNPVVFEAGRSVGTALVAWPVEQVVKCLVPFHPDDQVLNRLENEAQVKALHDAVQISGHELLIEIVPPEGPADVARRSAARDEAPLQPRHLSRVVEAAAACGVRMDRDRRADRRARSLLSRSRSAGPNAPIETLARGFADAAASKTCRGFAVGRTIFHEPARAWLAGADRRRRPRYRGAGEFRSVDRRVDGRAIRAMGDLSFMPRTASQSAMRSAIASAAFARSRSCAFIGISSMRRKRSAVETDRRQVSLRKFRMHWAWDFLARRLDLHTANIGIPLGRCQSYFRMTRITGVDRARSDSGFVPASRDLERSTGKESR